MAVIVTMKPSSNRAAPEMAPITVESVPGKHIRMSNSESKRSLPDMLSPSVVTGGGEGKASIAVLEIPEVVWPPSGGIVIAEGGGVCMTGGGSGGVGVEYAFCYVIANLLTRYNMA